MRFYVVNDRTEKKLHPTGISGAAAHELAAELNGRAASNPGLPTVSVVSVEVYDRHYEQRSDMGYDAEKAAGMPDELLLDEILSHDVGGHGWEARWANACRAELVRRRRMPNAKAALLAAGLADLLDGCRSADGDAQAPDEATIDRAVIILEICGYR